MASFLRLIVWALCLVVLPAHASFPLQTDVPIVRWTYSNNAENWYSDALASCRGTTRPTLTTGNTTGTANHQSTTCLDSIYAAGSAVQKFICPSTGGGSRFGYALSASETSCGTSSCPANSTASGGACQCNTGYQENAGKTACEVIPPKACAALGDSLGGAGAQHTSSGYKGGLICQDGCTAAPASAGKVGEVWYAWGPFTSMGTSCTGAVGGSGEVPASAPPSNQAPSPCAIGQCPGTFNGTAMCQPCDTTKEDPPPKKDESTVKNPDGSTTTTTTTTNSVSSCSGNSCNTTTTTTVVTGGKNADGTPKAPTTTKEEEVKKEETKGDFCKANPNHASCKDGSSSSFDGTCAGGFKAKSEDAVLNALAEETFRQNCKVTPDQASTQLATAEMAKTGDQTLTNPNNSTVAISQANFDTSNALGGGAACPADRQVQVWKWGFTLRMSSVCPSLEMLGAVMLAFSFLLGARIVARG